MRLIILCFLLVCLTAIPSHAFLKFGEGEDHVHQGVCYKTYVIESNGWYVRTLFDKKTDEPKFSFVESNKGHGYWLTWKDVGCNE